MKYRDRSEIQHHRAHIGQYYREKHSWGIREGKVYRWFEGIGHDAAILEIGCGSGLLARELAARGWRNLHLVDIDNYLEGDFGASLSAFHAVDVCHDTLPFRDQSMDCAVALQVFEHLENVWRPLREIYRVLKPGGYFIMSIPHIFGIRSRIQFFTAGDVEGYRENNDHIAVLPRAVFSKLIRGKFRVIMVDYQRPFTRIPFIHRKLRLPDTPFFGKRFSPKIAYVMQKIGPEQ